MGGERREQPIRNLAYPRGFTLGGGRPWWTALHSRRFSAPVTVYRMLPDGSARPTLITTTKEAYDALMEAQPPVANPAWQVALDAVVRPTRSRRAVSPLKNSTALRQVLTNATVSRVLNLPHHDLAPEATLLAGAEVLSVGLTTRRTKALRRKGHGPERTEQCEPSPACGPYARSES